MNVLDPTLLQKTLEVIAESNYKDVRVLEDGTIIGTIDLMFTRGLCVDITIDSWGHRYCYEDRSMATAACLAMKTGDDEPLAGFIAERHAKARPW